MSLMVLAALCTTNMGTAEKGVSVDATFLRRVYLGEFCVFFLSFVTDSIPKYIP